MLTADYSPANNQTALQRLTLESTLAELNLYDLSVEIVSTGVELARILERNALAPGAILMESGRLVGMISRQHFWERMSRPYGLELFGGRSLRWLYELTAIEHLVLPDSTLIVTAARCSLQRSPQLIYEPVVVETAPNIYKLLDVHHLFLAHSNIHELTTQLLQEQTQARLIQAEKMSGLGQMIASVAHEILNPVNFICGNINYLSNYGEDLVEVLSAYEDEFPQASTRLNDLKNEIDLGFVLEDFPQVISSIRVGAERLRKTIMALKNFSYMENTTPKLLDIHACLDDTLLILQGRTKHHILVETSYAELPLIEGYVGQLGQVFMNLLSNAIDALIEQSNAQTDSGWKAKIHVITQFYSNDPNWISVQIIDNGVGIPEEIQAQIFESFFTTKPVGKGTGLGLAISHQIVTENHHGKLSFSSVPGGNTCFEVVLPKQFSTLHAAH
jgi:signal transduction histidine kinase